MNVNISDLFEASLPLIPHELPRVRGSYGAFIITMHPEDFLKLTASSGDRERIEATTFPQDNHPANGRFPLPFLSVQWPNGKVTGHEGRHRALMVLRQGGRAFPVAIYMNTQHVHVVSYSEENEETGEFNDRVREFDNFSEAKAFASRLRSQPDENIYNWRVKLQTHGGDKLKGSPNFTDPTDPWRKKPFTVEDMPAQLIAQYDTSDTITVSNYRVGLVKGYRHFREAVELDEKVYRQHVRKPLAQLTVEDVKQAVKDNPDGISDAFSEMIGDWAEFVPEYDVQKTHDGEIQRNIEWMQREFQRYMENGRLPIYREVIITESGKLRLDDLGASWTPKPDTARSYNTPGEGGGEPHLITAWIADENVDWAATLMMRVHNSDEDEVRIYSSADVHFMGVDRR